MKRMLKIAMVVGLVAAAPAAFAGVDFAFGFYAPTPVYASPPPVYVAPQPIYVAPAPLYAEPAPVYVAPQPVYVAPAPVYAEPAPVYVAPPPAVYYRSWNPGWRHEYWERRERFEHARHWDWR